jgi:DNA-binding PadR family transcriptional regulator
MSKHAPDAAHFLPLTNLCFHVLLALGPGPAHGYAIGKEVEARSEGRLSPTTGGLYQALKRMVQDGLVEHHTMQDGDVVDRRRKYFRLTTLGREVAALESRRLDRLVAAAAEVKLFTDPA